jgi:hypothetical protein
MFSHRPALVSFDSDETAHTQAEPVEDSHESLIHIHHELHCCPGSTVDTKAHLHMPPRNQGWQTIAKNLDTPPPSSGPMLG